MDRIKTRQLCLFFACVAPVGKLINMPAALSSSAGANLLFSAAILFLAQGAIIFSLMKLSELTPLSFGELLKNTIGGAGEKIILSLLSLYFLFSSLCPLLEQKSYVQAAFYDSLPSLAVFLPFFIFSVFACTKNITAIGRSADLSAPLFIFSAAGLLFLAFGSSDFSVFLPVSAAAKSVFGGGINSLGWFNDSAFMLMLLGHFKGGKKSTVKVTLSYLAGGIITLIFLSVFYGIFSSTAPLQKYSIIKIAKYYKALAVLGRVDYFFTYVFSIVLIFYSVVPLQLATECLVGAFGEHRLSYSLAINAVMLILTIIFNYSYGALFNIFAKKLFWIFLLFQYAAPIFTLFLRRKQCRR